MNSTVDTADIQEKPIIKWRGEWGALYTVLIAVIGPDYQGANIVHYMEHNIKKGLLSSRQGEVNIEYLPGPSPPMLMALLSSTLETPLWTSWLSLSSSSQAPSLWRRLPQAAPRRACSGGARTSPPS